MLREILLQAWAALRHNPTRSLLTMTGIVWGVATVALLISYGDGFRGTIMQSFEAFGKAAIVAWPGQTSTQAGGERAGKFIRFEEVDIENVRLEGPYIKDICRETVRRLPIAYLERAATRAIRGVCPAYGEMRNEVPVEGRWITAEDMAERRRVAIIGRKVKEKLFGGRSPVNEMVTIGGVRFTIIGWMDAKLQMSNYFSSDDESVFIPYPAAAELWDTRFASTVVFTPVAPQFEKKAIEQFRTALSKRQRFSEKDERAVQAFGREQFRPVLDGITIGLQTLLLFIGVLTLGIGGVGVMNIMLVSVNERIREIGIRRALGARRSHIRLQFLAEAFAITAAGGLLGILTAYLIATGIGRIEMMGLLFEDDSGRGDIVLHIRPLTVIASAAVLAVTGIIAGWAPAVRASSLDPADALRYE